MPRTTYLAVLCLLALTACGGPIGVVPGGELSGEEASASLWSEVVSASGTFDLETRPENPHSVRIGFFFRDGNVYIDPAENRGWYQNLRADPSVRVRIDDRIYRARAVPVTDPDELEGFDPERHVHRLELLGGDADATSATEAMLATGALELTIDATSFGCITDMTGIRHFFVDNLLGDVDATVAAAESSVGGAYPPGSVVQLVPTEAMVKHPPGFSPATRDWEFFELDVTAEGTSITTRGFADVVNRFGGNCLDCHIKAEPQYDLICELDHGCDPIPVTREQVAAIQAADPRCTG